MARGDEDSDTTLNVEGLDKLLKALKSDMPTARVGILGEKNTRSSKGGSAPTNAEIGAAHEFGAPARGLPQRSFLRVPLSENLQKKMESSGALDQDVMKAVLKQGTVIPWLKKIAVLAEGIVSEAFDTGGFGKWPKWKSPNYSNNANQLLVDTAQLRNSITSEVK
jgi:hypothetical protein